MLQQVYEFERRASVVTVVEEPYLVAECGSVRTVTVQQPMLWLFVYCTGRDGL